MKPWPGIEFETTDFEPKSLNCKEKVWNPLIFFSKAESWTRLVATLCGARVGGH